MSQDYEVMLAKDVPGEGIVGLIPVVRGHVEGAYPNGTFVVKCDSHENDSYPDGTLGMVISSLLGDDDTIGYQVVFSCEHPIPTLISAERVREIPPPTPTRE